MTGIRTVTPKELEVGKLIQQGYTYEEIADAMGISPRTAKSYTDRLKLKLNVEKKRHIPAALKEKGLI